MLTAVEVDSKRSEMDTRYSRKAFAAKLGANGDPKLNAAADFAARLLNGPVGNRVVRIILFGSVAGGVAGPNSDVDIMVFANAPRQQLSKAAGEAAWEATLEFGELVAPLTYPLSRLFYQRPYVVYDTLRRGREIYAMDEGIVRREEILNLRRKAEENLMDAEAVLKQGITSLAVVGAYTAAELAAKALILLKPSLELPHTHGGTLQMFSREYVKTGEAPRTWARLLDENLRLRSGALYDPDVTATPEQAQSTIRLAQEMLDFLQRKLGETGGSQP